MRAAHPVAVALDGVDLAVVRDEPERLRERPRREGVRREARVDERELARVARVGQVREERLELRRGEHALVGEGAGGQRREEDAELVLGALAQPVRARGPGRRPRSSRDGSATTSWRNVGMEARAVGPTRSAVTGTSRQARTSSFSSAAMASMPRTAAAWPAASVGRNAMPIAYCPAGGSSASTTSRRKASGIWVRMPAPSPLSGSAPTAPRWSRLSRAVRPASTMSRPGRAPQGRHERDAAGVVLVRRGRRDHRRPGRRALERASTTWTWSTVLTGPTVEEAGGR